MSTSSTNIVVYRTFATPTGEFFLGQTADGDLRTGWLVERRDRAVLSEAERDRSFAPRLSDLIERYFAGEAVRFDRDDMAATPSGPPFFEKCWRACRRIPRGQTRSYAQLAEMAGSTVSASRAAGQAMRNNPLPVIVPCHRVIAAGGDLHGFAGSCDGSSEALARKRTLLELEGWVPPDRIGERRMRSRKRLVTTS